MISFLHLVYCVYSLLPLSSTFLLSLKLIPHLCLWLHCIAHWFQQWSLCGHRLDLSVGGQWAHCSIYIWKQWMPLPHNPSVASSSPERIRTLRSPSLYYDHLLFVEPLDLGYLTRSTIFPVPSIKLTLSWFNFSLQMTWILSVYISL